MKLSAFRAFTFDCYGTLIDWDRGILQALRVCPALVADDQSLLAAFRRYENPLKTQRPALPYPEVLCRTFKAIANEFGHAATDHKAGAFAASIADWPPFADSLDSLGPSQRVCAAAGAIERRSCLPRPQRAPPRASLP